jgi:hypothetical protein
MPLLTQPYGQVGQGLKIPLLIYVIIKIIYYIINIVK